MAYSFIVERDECELNHPRDCDNLGVIVTWHRRYALGDQQPKQAPEEWLADLKKTAPRAIILPVYMYDHGGITISTTPFNCRWDSGQLGIIYTTPERVRDWLGYTRITAKRRAGIEARLAREIDYFDRYLTGNIYRFDIMDETGEWIDGAGGFFDHAEAEAEAEATIARYYEYNRKGARHADHSIHA